MPNVHLLRYAEGHRDKLISSWPNNSKEWCVYDPDGHKGSMLMSRWAVCLVGPKCEKLMITEAAC